jgi:hypothetical protein
VGVLTVAVVSTGCSSVDADCAGGMVIISPAIWACVTPLVLDELQQIFLARLSIMGKTVSISGTNLLSAVHLYSARKGIAAKLLVSS